MTRETKADRRARILSEARALLATEGFDGLSLRRLAAHAGVTVPTIYNLVGGKEQILLDLASDLLAEVEAALKGVDEDKPLERAEAVVTVAIAAIERAPEFQRAALLAIDYLDRDGTQSTWERMGKRAAAMQEGAARTARNLGLLRGEIPADLIGSQIFRIYRAAARDWCCRRFSLTEFRRIALTGVYLTLAADASEEFRQVLLFRLSSISATSAAH